MIKMSYISIIQDLTSWKVISQNDNHVRVASPFNFGNDGSCITFNVILKDNKFTLTDFAEHIMLAESLGAKLSKDKYRSLNETFGVAFANFDMNGEITASGDLEYLQFALFDAAKLALSLSFNYTKWLPKFNQVRFRSLVETQLRKNVPEKNIIIDFETKGITGHTIRFPFALKDNDRMILIEPIALQESNKINWADIYKAHGKFADNKRLDETNKRVAILESTAEETEQLGRASTLLADVSNIHLLTRGESLSFKSLRA